jgi:hypothetical protein
MADWQQLTLHGNDGRTLEVSADLDSLILEEKLEGTSLFKARLSVMIAQQVQEITCIFDEADGAAMPISVTADDMNALRSAAGVADEGELPPPSATTEENDAAVEEAIVAAAPPVEDIGPEPEPESQPSGAGDAPAAAPDTEAAPAARAAPEAAPETESQQPAAEHPAAQPQAQPVAAQADAGQADAGQQPAAQADAGQAVADQQPAAEQAAQPTVQQDKYYEDYENWILAQQPIVIYHRTDTSRSLSGLTWSDAANRIPTSEGTWTVEVRLVDATTPLHPGPHHLTIQAEGERYYVFLDAEDFEAVERARNAAAVAADQPSTSTPDIQTFEPTAAVAQLDAASASAAEGYGSANAGAWGTDVSGAAADGIAPFDETTIGALRLAAASNQAVFLSGTFAPAEVTVDWEALAADRTQWMKVAGVGWTGALKCAPVGGTEMTEVAGAVLHAAEGQSYWLEIPADAVLQTVAPSANEGEPDS